MMGASEGHAKCNEHMWSSYRALGSICLFAVLTLFDLLVFSPLVHLPACRTPLASRILLCSRSISLSETTEYAGACSAVGIWCLGAEVWDDVSDPVGGSDLAAAGEGDRPVRLVDREELAVD